MTCVFSGSFDPFHNGHLEIVKVLLEHKFVKRVIIAPNNPNKTKINRSDLNIRIQFIQLALEMCNDEIKNKIKIEPRLIDDVVTSDMCGVMGSDQYLLLQEKDKLPKLQVDKWFIVPRHGYEILEIKNAKFQMLGKHLFRHQNMSSTKIRNLILENKSVYLQLMSTKAIELALKVYLNHKKNQVVIKNNVVFKQFNEINKYKNELRAFQFLNIYKPKNVLFPKLISHDDEKMMLEMENVGQSILTITDQKECFEIGFQIGTMMKSLHTFDTIEIKLDKSHGKIAKLDQKCDPELVAEFLNHPGPLGHVHGDASILNFVYKSETKQVFMIDFGGICKYQSHGIPVYEYFQFLSSLVWQKASDEILKGFQKGYGDIDKCFTKQGIEICRQYWKIK
jgi:nicotinic acid mononucleotide adenylyltransferase/tRNA A-37 threonylcarbamoyl transferase component Bud32